jgi:hypothetical protein
MNTNSLINFIVIIYYKYELKKPKLKKLREIHLIDRNFQEIILILWDKIAIDFKYKLKEIIMIKNLTINEYKSIKKLEFNKLSKFNIETNNKNYLLLNEFLILNNELISNKIKLFKLFFEKPIGWSNLNIKID